MGLISRYNNLMDEVGAEERYIYFWDDINSGKLSIDDVYDLDQIYGDDVSDEDLVQEMIDSCEDYLDREKDILYGVREELLELELRVHPAENEWLIPIPPDRYYIRKEQYIKDIQSRLKLIAKFRRLRNDLRKWQNSTEIKRIR